ncbi:SMP-30/gluconolactonase/LRE family protein [Flavobacterium sp. HSC-61S13]|uniref:SMP-30/gluconolactonase/LRE family protein n=1 Tax=Flavobacterium sp. HSC-61S13 TaxID=2910963 RepID=UPI0020A13418|nr:SMP-30/gluconolactonase/LRE family protein [Flavobacterium sp. HSC-61S13]MCP1996008.1 hypothetical protein [Flavobacterium sp. HSC-61S13]
MKKMYYCLFCSLYFTITTVSQTTNKKVSFSHYIEGIVNPEDLIFVTDQNWVIISSMASATHSGKIYALHKEESRKVLLFDSAQAGIPVDHLKSFSPHGIYVNKYEEDYMLYVISHGKKETIEIFNLYFNDGNPQINWKDSLDLPATVWANGLVVDRDKKIYVSSMYDPSDPDFLEKFQRKEVTGQIWNWSIQDQWTPFSKDQFSGANGIAISSDQKSLYLSEWANQQIHQLTTSDGTITKSIVVDFLPDNIRGSGSGNLLIAGQIGDPKHVFLSKGISETNMYFSVIALNPSLSDVKKIISGGNIQFANATVAIDVGQYYWLGCVENNKIAVYFKN